MAWVIGFANEDQVKQIVEAGFYVTEVAGECEQVLRNNYPPADDGTQHLVWVNLDIELHDLLDISMEKRATERM